MRTLNLRLLIWLGALSLLTIVGAYLLNRFQVQRNAHYLLELADEAEKKDDLMGAVRHVKRYLAFDPTNGDANARFALRLTDYVESTESTMDQYNEAYNALESALRRFPERDDVRRRLAEFAPKFGRYEISIEQYEEMLKKPPADAEDIRLKLGECYERNDDNEQALNLYTDLVQSSPGNLAAYLRRARVLRTKLNEPAQADEAVDQMVAANENSAKAYLERARYLQESRMSAGSATKFEQVTQRLEDDMRKALSLGPDDQEALLFAGEYLLQSKGPAEARGHFEHLLEVSPGDMKARRWLAILDWTDGKRSEAVGQLKSIFDEHPDEREIQWFLADYQLRNMDTEGARATVASIRTQRDVKKKLPLELLDLLDARAMMNERRFSDAVKLLDTVRPRLVRDPGQAIQVDLFMAICYSELGQPDLQLQSYQRALLLDPTSLPARKGLALALVAQGRADEAIAELEQIVQRDPEVPGMIIQLKTQKLARGGSEQDLESIKEIIEKYNKDRGGSGGATGMDTSLLQADLLAAQGDLPGAKKLIQAKIDEDPTAANPWLALANVTLKGEGTQASLKVLNDAIGKIPDNLQLKLARIDVLSRTGDDEGLKAAALEQLRQTLAESDSYPEEQQTGFWDKLGGAFLRLGDSAMTKDLWKRVVDRRPTDPQSHLRLFAVMMDAKDEAGVNAALDGLREQMGEASAEYNYAEAARRIYALRTESADDRDKALTEADDFLNRGLQQRAQWHVLHTALAEVEALRGNESRAIEKYQESVQLGERSPVHIRNLIALLTKAERYPEVSDAIKLIKSVGGNTDELDILEFIVDREKGTLGDDDGRVTGRVAKSENARELVMLGQLLFERRDWDGAEGAYQKATAVSPEAPEGWIALVNLYRATARPGQAEKTIKEAEGKVAPDMVPLALARCYEILGRDEEAKKYYEQSLTAKPDELRVKRQVASFYLLRGENEPGQKLLDEILAKASTADPNDQVHVEWARRQSARMIAARGGYKNLQEALVFIDQNAREGVLTYDDLVFKAELLGRREDLQSKREAVELLERARQARKKLPPAVTLEMAKQYDRIGEWSKCRDEMVQLLRESPDNSAYQAVYIEMLIRHDELNEAQPRIDQLVAADPNSTVAIEAKSRLLVVQDKIDSAIELLESMIPNPTPPDQQGVKRTVAGFMISLARSATPEGAKALRSAAERIIRNYVEAVPNEQLLLANFLGEHGDLEECLTMCQKYVDGGTLQSPIEVALANLRNRRNEATEKQFARVEGWIQRARKEIKSPFAAKFFEADLRDIQGKYDETEAIYRDVLAQQGLRDAETVTALNNLAYIVAMRDNNGEEAIQLIQKAIDINGPMAELLDTRGMVQVSLNKPEEAIKDIEAALVERPDWLKFLHLAVAQLRANRIEAVSDAYQEAERRGLNERQVPPLERKFFVEVKQAVEADKQQARN